MVKLLIIRRVKLLRAMIKVLITKTANLLCAINLVVKITSYKTKATTKTSAVKTDANGKIEVFKINTKNIFQGLQHWYP